jgi:hypothetical protein
MARPRPPLSDAQRAALLRFEALYEEWRVASASLLDAEQALLDAAMLADGGVPPEELAQRLMLLRAAERNAYTRALAAVPGTAD